MHTLGKQLVGYLADVVDFCHCHYGVTPQVRVDDDGLRVGVAYHADALVALEIVELILEFGAEIASFDAVNSPAEAFFLVESYETCTFSAKM